MLVTLIEMLLFLEEKQKGFEKKSGCLLYNEITEFIELNYEIG